MKESFNVEDDKMIMLVFSILSITGPTLGVIIGGVLGSYIGGYESKNCALMCSVFCLLSAFAALPIGLVNFIPFLVTVLLNERTQLVSVANDKEDTEMLLMTNDIRDK